MAFIFGGNTGISSQQELARRRKIAEALTQQALSGGRAPRSVGEAIGEGLSGLGEAFLARRANANLDDAEKRGEAGANTAFNALFGGAPSPAPSLSGAGNYADAIASIESAGSGNYSALGPITDSGDRAYGRYQVMGANIGPWTEAALGKRLTPEQFLASPEAQDAVFKHVFNGYVDKFGPEGAAQAWFGGPGAVGKTDRKDMLGTSVGEYGDKFMANLGAVPKTDRLPMPEAGAQIAATSPNTRPAPVQTASLSPTAGAGAASAPPPLSPPRNVSTPPTPPATAQQPNMQALAQRFGGSQQLANANPRQGILTALLAGQGNGAPKAGFPAAPAPNSRLNQIAAVLSNPFSNDGQKAVAAALLKQELAKNDPNNALDAEYKRAQIAKLQADAEKALNPLADQKFGLQPQYGIDENGNPVILQLGNNGVATQTKLPEGVTLSKQPIKLDAGTEWIMLDPITRQPVATIPKNVGEEAAQKAAGKVRGETAANIPTSALSASQAIQQLDQLIDNPGLNSVVGPIDQYRPSWTLGDRGRDALARIDQIKGRTFLQAYETLKGGGQITEVEGQKAENAMARLNRAQSEDDFRQALRDLRDVIVAGQKRLLEKAGVPRDQWGNYLPQEKPSGPVQINGYTIQEVQ